LYYRLKVFPITLPPLRDRKEDIPHLAQHFLQHCRVKLDRGDLLLADSVLPRLMQYEWPGNVRELQNVIERAAILTPTSLAEIDKHVMLPPSISTAVIGAPATLHDSERRHILHALERTAWRIYGPLGAARQLGLNPSTLRSRMKKLGLSRPTTVTPPDQRSTPYPTSVATYGGQA
jgi:formate hydrogenlyase transcriptional activator